jgi:hypothetical protein
MIEYEVALRSSADLYRVRCVSIARIARRQDARICGLTDDVRSGRRAVSIE